MCNSAQCLGFLICITLGSSPDGVTTFRQRLRESQREIGEINDGTSRLQEVHPKDTSYVEAVVHSANLNLESIQTLATDVHAIDAAGENDLASSNSAKGSKTVVGLWDDTDRRRDTGIEQSACGAGVNKDVGYLDRRTTMGDGYRDER